MEKKGEILTGFEISIATNKDEYQILRLLKDAAKWLKEHNIVQWSYLGEGGDDDEIKQAIHNQETFIVKYNDSIVATFTLYKAQSCWDQHIWRKFNDDAVYLHRLALTRTKIGSGLGKAVLQWIEDDLKKDGIKIIRLDCVANNIKLNHFYLRNGFEKVDINHEHSKYQKYLGD